MLGIQIADSHTDYVVRSVLIQQLILWGKLLTLHLVLFFRACTVIASLTNISVFALTYMSILVMHQNENLTKTKNNESLG